MAEPESPMGLPPELNDDVTAEILLRVAPDEPARLFRTSLVCKLWHRIISDPDFCRRYRSFHRGAPLLGFFYNHDFSAPYSSLEFPPPFSRFVATTPASPLPKAPKAAATHDGNSCVSRALDCHHGRVLLKKAYSRDLAVWDPIADEWTDLPPLSIWYMSYTAVVLCDEAGCDHRDCRGGRFLVVCVGTDCTVLRKVYACVYSSEDRAWRTPVSDSIGYSGHKLFLDRNRPALIGDRIYCTILDGEEILMYDLVQRSFALIGMPHKYTRHPVLMQNEDGSLGLGGMRGSRLYLGSRTWNNPEEGDAAGWVLRTVIKLKKLLPVDNKHWINANVIGFAEGVDVFIISTNVGVFTLDLKSRRVMMVSKPSKKYRSVVPFISFFTSDCASSRVTNSQSIKRSEMINIM